MRSRALGVQFSVLGSCETQEPMVRHEAAEALGAVGDPSARDILKQYSNDGARDVAETCQLALDRMEWLSDKETSMTTIPTALWTLPLPAWRAVLRSGMVSS